MNFRILIVFIFITSEIFLGAKEKSFSLNGEWFSGVRRQPKGFDARELYFFKSYNSNKFVFSQISFNETRKWEETRYSGKWELEDGDFGIANLKAEGCSVYASSELGKKWVLIRAFDCDHLTFRAKIHSEKELTLSPTMDFENSETFQRVSSNPDSIQSLIISTDAKNFTSWGIRMNAVRKGSTSYISKKTGAKIPAQVSETVDSSAIYKTDGLVEIGDMLVTKNKKTGGVFE